MRLRDRRFPIQRTQWWSVGGGYKERHGQRGVVIDE